MRHYNEYLFGTWNIVPSPLSGFLKLKVDTNKNKENNENESCSTVYHDVIIRFQIFLFCFEILYIWQLMWDWNYSTEEELWKFRVVKPDVEK